MLQFIKYYVVSYILIYLGMAFCLLELNPFYWDWFNRAGLIFGSLIISLATWIFNNITVLDDTFIEKDE